MNTKTLLLMLVGALVFWGSTVLLKSSANESRPVAAGPLLQGLKANVNDVRSMTIEQGADKLEFARGSDGRWSLASRHDYPGDRKKLDTLVLALARAEKMGAKTKLPARYGQLGLAADGDNPATRVELKNAQGKSMHNVWIGDKRGRTTEEAYFVRVEGDPTCWLVSGKLSANANMTDWLDADLLNVTSTDITGVRMVHPDGEEVLLGREDGTEPTQPLTILNLPEGKEPQSEWVTSRCASALQGLKIDDVQLRSESTADWAQAVQSEFWTKEGLRYTVSTLEEGEQTLATLAASVDPTGAPKPMVGPTIDSELPNILDPEAAATENEAPELDRERLEKSALEFNERTKDWAFVLPSWKAGAMRVRMDELIKTEGDTADPFADPESPGGSGPGAKLLNNVEEAPLQDGEIEDALSGENLNPDGLADGNPDAAGAPTGGPGGVPTGGPEGPVGEGAGPVPPTQPGDEPMPNPAGNAPENAGGKPAGDPVENNAEKNADKTPGEPAEKPGGKPADKPADKIEKKKSDDDAGDPVFEIDPDAVKDGDPTPPKTTPPAPDKTPEKKSDDKSGKGNKDGRS